ncbi:MAG: hypothetical protein HYT79_06495 [Elusimicrobia bacterium]|nr:hypothetical protein [Elusimicrobiota bacterium]
MKLKILLMLFLSGMPGILRAAGLASRFSEVTIDDVQPGVAYGILEAAGLPLSVQNKSESAVLIRVDVQKPEAARDGFEPIPDIGWVKLEKSEFKIKAGREGATDIVIAIPDDNRLLGKKFQVNFWSRSVGPGLQLGLLSSLRLSVAAKRLSTEDLARHVQGIKNRSLWAVEFWPPKVILADVAAGRAYDAQKDGHAIFRLVNTSERKQRLALTVRSFEQAGVGLPSGYEDCPDPSWVSASQRIKIRSKKEKRVHVALALPDESRGRRFACVLEAVIDGAPVDWRPATQIFVETVK